MPLVPSVVATAILMDVLQLATCSTFGPRPEIGYPAGLLSECPGVTKNTSISSRTLEQLHVVVQRFAKDGQVIRKSLPIMMASKMIAKDKAIDLKNKKTVLYAVGFWDSAVFPHSQAIGNAYCRRGYNVFLSETFSVLTYIYPKSVRLTRVIGKRMGEFLAKLTDQGLSPENLELVGISLGAHIVGYAAKHFYALTGRKPSRITGLDPAGPCFRTLPPELRLDSSDAEHVDVVHTNIDGFGIAEPLGHIDIYVNGGEFQPGDIPYIPCLVICSHFRATLYWWQAIEHPKKFIGVKCESVQDARFANCFNGTEINYLGLEAKFEKPGIYYLSTSNEFPYFRGREGLKAENEIYKSVVRRINSEEFEI